MTRLIDAPAIAPWKRALRRLLPHRHAATPPPPAAMVVDDDVTDGGERIRPEDNNFCFFAHQSIYAFAKPHVAGRRVLDAGCGTGYGSHLLKQAGAGSVMGIDLSEKAIRHCQARYGQNDGMSFAAMDLQEVRLQNQRFGLIFSSNVLEHVPDADAFLEAATRMLEPGGVFVMAVPTIVNVEALEANLENRYHVNNITPKAWAAKLERFFGRAQGYRHWVRPEWVAEDGGCRADDAIRAEDFVFTEQTPDQMMAQPRTITTVFVCHDPRPSSLPRTAAETAYPADWDIVDGRPKRAAQGIVGPILPDRRIVQTFRCGFNGLRRIDIMMDTYGRVRHSSLLIQVRYDSIEGPIIVELARKAEQIHDRYWNSFEFDPIADSKDRAIALVLQGVEDWPREAVTAYYTDKTFPGAEQLCVNWLPYPGSLWLHCRGGSAASAAQWDLVGPILPNRPVAQTFRCDQDDLCGVEVQLATYARVNTSTLRATIRRGSPRGEVLAVVERPAGEMLDNKWNAFDFPPIASCRDEVLALVLDSPDATSENCVTAYCSEPTSPIAQRLTINDLPSADALHFWPVFDAYRGIKVDVTTDHLDRP